MTPFKLDTSGAVADYRRDGLHTLADVGVVLPGTPQVNIERARRLSTGWTWPDLSPFVQGYIEAALEDLTRTVTWLTEHTFEEPAFHMLAPETLERIMGDCERFLTFAREVCAVKGYDNSKADGAWWWDARQRGEWTAQGYLPQTLYLADDRKVRFRD